MLPANKKKLAMGIRFLFCKPVITLRLGGIVFFPRTKGYDLPDPEFIFGPLACKNAIVQ